MNPCQPSVCGTCPLVGACGSPLPDLRTPREWGAEFGVEILDPDGWRMKDAPSFDEPITREDYSRRMAVSTIRRLPAVERPDVDPAEPRPEGAGCCGGSCR